MRLFGGEWTRRELEAHTGRLDQVLGARPVRLTDGPAAGSEAIHVRTGGGLSFWIHPGRGMDIGLADFLGTPLTWQSQAGDRHAGSFEPEGLGWLRSAAGGLLMTCGLRQVGSPCEDEGEQLGIHGRLHHTPARELGIETEWRGDELAIRVRGVLEESRLFGENLRLTRVYTITGGENRFEIEDRIENVGFEPSPLMTLYHFNLGFPLVSPEAEPYFPPARVIPRDEGIPVAGHDAWQRPTPGYTERVYYHEGITAKPFEAWGRPVARAGVRNGSFPVGPGGHSVPVRLEICWTTDSLPRLVQWKMAGAGAHVLGIEPANCHVEGRAEERRKGSLQFLEPGGTIVNRLSVSAGLLRPE